MAKHKSKSAKSSASEQKTYEVQDVPHRNPARAARGETEQALVEIVREGRTIEERLYLHIQRNGMHGGEVIYLADGRDADEVAEEFYNQAGAPEDEGDEIDIGDGQATSAEFLAALAAAGELDAEIDPEILAALAAGDNVDCTDDSADGSVDVALDAREDETGHWHVAPAAEEAAVVDDFSESGSLFDDDSLMGELLGEGSDAGSDFSFGSYDDEYEDLFESDPDFRGQTEAQAEAAAKAAATAVAPADAPEADDGIEAGMTVMLEGGKLTFVGKEHVPEAVADLFEGAEAEVTPEGDVRIDAGEEFAIESDLEALGFDDDDLEAAAEWRRMAAAEAAAAGGPAAAASGLRVAPGDASGAAFVAFANAAAGDAFADAAAGVDLADLDLDGWVDGDAGADAAAVARMAAALEDDEAYAAAAAATNAACAALAEPPVGSVEVAPEGVPGRAGRMLRLYGTEMAREDAERVMADAQARYQPIDVDEAEYEEDSEEAGRHVWAPAAPRRLDIDCMTVAGGMTDTARRPVMIGAQPAARPAIKVIATAAEESDDDFASDDGLTPLRVAHAARPRKESKEEKRERKKAAKAAQAERRAIKKAVKGAYRAEAGHARRSQVRNQERNRSLN